MVREVAEETGYRVRVEQPLGVDSRPQRVDWEGPVVFQAIGVFYRVCISGGQLRNEVGGSTDLAAWIPMREVPELERAVIVDVGLQLHNIQPPTGHVPPIPVEGAAAALIDASGGRTAVWCPANGARAAALPGCLPCRDGG